MKRYIKKKVINEYDGVFLGIDILFYSIFIAIGIFILDFQFIDYVNSIDCAIEVFYILGFFSILSYFLNRRPNDYEFLFFGLINIITGLFISNNYNYNSYDILGYAVCLYTLMVVLNKGYFAKKLLNNDSYDLFPKLIVTILLMMLGFFVTYHFLGGVTIENMLLGYYLVAFGLVGLLEPLFKIIFRIPIVEKFLDKILKEDKTKENKVKKDIKETIKVEEDNKEIIKEKEDVKKEDKTKKINKEDNKEVTKKVKSSTKKDVKKVKKPIKKELTKVSKSKDKVTTKNKKQN